MEHEMTNQVELFKTSTLVSIQEIGKNIDSRIKPFFDKGVDHLTNKVDIDLWAVWMKNKIQVMEIANRGMTEVTTIDELKAAMA